AGPSRRSNAHSIFVEGTMDSGSWTAWSGTPARLRALQFSDRNAALGLAVNYLMTKPAFARLPFGHWARVLTGGIHPGESVVISDESTVLGFAGWAFASAPAAEAWLAGHTPAIARPDAGDCLMINAWAAETLRAHQFLLREVRRRAAGAVAIYGRREYADGRSRAVRISV